MIFEEQIRQLLSAPSKRWARIWPLGTLSDKALSDNCNMRNPH
jgi:hypothetical protein